MDKFLFCRPERVKKKRVLSWSISIISLWCHPLFVPCRGPRAKLLTLSARSGTTVPNFFVFFAKLWLLIIVRLCSNLRCWIVHHLSFLEKKTELLYLHYRPFYNCSSIMFLFWPKNVQKDVRTVKKPKLFFNLFPW